MVDLVYQQAAFRVLQQVDCEHSAADSLRGALAELVQIRSDCALTGGGAARSVGQPMLGVAIDCHRSLVANHKSADVAARLFNQLLYVIQVVLEAAQNLAMFEDRFGCIAVVDAVDQASPRANHRLDDIGVAQFLPDGQRRLRGEGEAGARLWQPGTGKGGGGGYFVAANRCHRIRVDRGHADAVERLTRIQPAAGTQAANDDRIVALPIVRGGQIERDLAVQQPVIFNVALIEGGEQPFFLDAQTGIENANTHGGRNVILPSPRLLRGPA